MSITRKVIIPKGMETLYEKYHYCPGLRVGDILYISGQVGRDENLQVIEDTEAQFVQAFENVKQVLSAADANFDDVVEMVTYHVMGIDSPAQPPPALATGGDDSPPTAVYRGQRSLLYSSIPHLDGRRCNGIVNTGTNGRD